MREARIHVRHVRDLLKSLDPTDAYNGIDCSSLSFLSAVTQGDILGKDRINPKLRLKTSLSNRVCMIRGSCRKEKTQTRVGGLYASGFHHAQHERQTSRSSPASNKGTKGGNGHIDAAADFQVAFF